MSASNDAYLTRLDFRKAGAMERKLDGLMADADLEAKQWC